MRSAQLRVVWLLSSLLAVFFALYAFWSYSLTDPNLVFTSWRPYWDAQQWLWQTVFANSQLLAQIYLGLLAGIWIVYLGLVYLLHTYFPKEVMRRNQWIFLVIVLLPLFFAYNALSHDMFNYIFNARMVVEYGADPHVQTALDFATDPWVRFMHNTHTPAPYGYGWTAVSLLPYVLGFGKFTLTWVLFKVTAAASFVALVLTTNWIAATVRKQPLRWFEAALLFLNPLLVVEILGNGHNDLWMIVPALLAVGISLRWGTRRLAWLVGLLLFSVSIKYATVLLLPVFAAILYAENMWERVRSKLLLRLPLRMVVPVAERLFGEWVRKNVLGVVASVSAFLLLLPLLTSRSQQFHPWYLLWSLVWLPFISIRFLRVLLVSFSISSLFRYIPWMVTGGYVEQTLLQQVVITWVGGMVLMLSWLAWSSVRLRSGSRFLQKL